MASPIWSLALAATSDVCRPAMRPILSSSFSTAPRCFWIAATLGPKSDERYWNILTRDEECGQQRRHAPVAQAPASSHQLGNCKFVPRVCRRGAANCLPSSDRHRRQSVDIGDDIDHRGTLRRKRLRERRRESRRFFDADAERAHVLCDAGEIDLAEGPQFARLLGLLAAIDAIEAAL